MSKSLPPRKIIQIACIPGYSGKTHRGVSVLYGLADDGTMWSIIGNEDEWIQLPPLPQPLETIEEEET